MHQNSKLEKALHMMGICK